MKKVIALMVIFSFVCAPIAHAKKLSDVTSEDAATFVETTIRETGKGVVKAIKYTPKAAYYVVKYTLKGLAVPFYWLERITGNEQS